MALQLLDNILSNLDEKTDTIQNEKCQVEKLNIRGLCAAVYTSFNELNELNLSAIPEQAAYLNATGVSSIFVAGTTGESTSLTMNEKKVLISEWMKYAKSKYNFTVIFHVGTNCIKDSQQLAIYGRSVGVDGIGLMPPSYFKPNCIESLIISVKEIADCVPTLPVYYYHIPSMTGVNISMYDFIICADQRIPNLVGIKYTGLYNNLSFPILQKILNYKDGKRYEIMTGRDEMIVQCLTLGVVGFVGSQYNFAGNLYNGIIEKYENGDIKQALQLQLNALSLLDIQISDKIGKNKNAGKYLMNLINIKCGKPRTPFLSLNQNEKQFIQNQLQKWCKQTDQQFIVYK